MRQKIKMFDASKDVESQMDNVQLRATNSHICSHVSLSNDGHSCRSEVEARLVPDERVHKSMHKLDRPIVLDWSPILYAKNTPSRETPLIRVQKKLTTISSSVGRIA